MQSLEEKTKQETLLQKKIRRLEVTIGKIGVIAAFVIIHAFIIRFFVFAMIRREFDLFGGMKFLDDKKTSLVSCTDEEDCKGQILQYVKELLDYVIMGIAIIIVAIPEGLPLAVMISLSFSVNHMLKNNIKVKKL